MTKPVRTVAPASLPVPLDEAKSRLGISGTDEDATLTALIGAATDYLDGRTGALGRCLITQTWAFHLDYWPSCGHMVLPFPDVQSVVVTYRDTDDAEQTLAGGEFEVFEADCGSVLEFIGTLPNLSDRNRAVTITMTVGYGEASDVPETIRSAIILTVSRLRNLSSDAAFLRSETVEGVGSQSWSTTDAGRSIGSAVDALVAPYRRVFL